MLKIALLHPEILSALSVAGHGSRVLIAAGNYAYNTHANPMAPRVFLNLTAGVLSATQVLDVLTQVVPFTHAQVMQAPALEEPLLWGDFRQLLPGVSFDVVDKTAFHEAATNENLDLIIVTGDQHPYSSILLTIGIQEAVTLTEPSSILLEEANPIAEPVVAVKEEKAPRAKKTTKTEPAPEITELAPEAVIEPEAEIEEVVAIVEPTPEPEPAAEVIVEETLVITEVITEADLSDPFADDVPAEAKPEKKVEIEKKTEPEKKPEEAPAFGSLFE
jgi:L-fucose mutarotase